MTKLTQALKNGEDWQSRLLSEFPIRSLFYSLEVPFSMRAPTNGYFFILNNLLFSWWISLVYNNSINAFKSLFQCWRPCFCSSWCITLWEGGIVWSSESTLDKLLNLNFISLLSGQFLSRSSWNCLAWKLLMLTSLGATIVVVKQTVMQPSH